MPVKPCKATCEKCGSGDVLHRHHLPGTDARTGISIDGGRTTEYVDRPSCMAWHVKTECIVHTCRVCGWYWDGPVMAKGRRK